MINKHVLTEDHAMHAIKNGEFSRELISAENVVIIMTQDWCPQWISMKNWIYKIETDENIEIYELIYNRATCFSEFLHFKERSFGNCEIPYLRYYKNGEFIQDTNYINSESFCEILGLK